MHCGLLVSETNHGKVGECVDALQREADRLRDVLRQVKPGAPAASERASAGNQ
jgi:hypothetical protein